MDGGGYFCSESFWLYFLIKSQASVRHTRIQANLCQWIVSLFQNWLQNNTTCYYLVFKQVLVWSSLGHHVIKQETKRTLLKSCTTQLFFGDIQPSLSLGRSTRTFSLFYPIDFSPFQNFSCPHFQTERHLKK